MRGVTTNRGHFHFERVADVDREVAGIALQILRLEGQAEIKLRDDGVDRQVIIVQGLKYWMLKKLRT